jgi:hypothetical protein
MTAIAPHYWIGDRGVATGANIPPAPVTFILAADYIAARRAEGVACVDEEASS